MEDKLKSQADYPPIYFRVSQEEKKAIEDLIDQIMKQRLRGHAPGTKLPKRNKLILEALTIGLEQIKRKMKKS
jgi:hypothetical protein